MNVTTALTNKLKSDNHCSSVNSHSLDFKHGLMILFHKVLLVGVFSVDVLNRLAEIIILGIEVERLCHTWDFDTCFSVIVSWENFRESISHSEFTIECSSHESLSFVETSISHCVPGSRRKGVVAIITEKLALKFQCRFACAAHFDRLSSTRGIASCVSSSVR